MDDVVNLDDRPEPASRDGGTAALFASPKRGSENRRESLAEEAPARGSVSLVDRLGRLLGLDESLRRWMLIDRLGALLGLGIGASEALGRLRETASGEAERAALDRAAERLAEGGGLAEALAAAGGYRTRDLDLLRAPPGDAGEAAALAEVAAKLRRRLTLRYSFALAGAALAVLLAVLLIGHRSPRQELPPAPVAQRAIPTRSAARPTPPPPADLAPPLGPGLAGAPPPLVGIVGRLPDDAVAMVRMPSGRARMLAVGAVFDGWTLASLNAEEAVFARDGQRVTVALPPADDQ